MQTFRTQPFLSPFVSAKLILVLNGTRHWRIYTQCNITLLFGFLYRSEVWIILKKSVLLSIIECFSFIASPTATFFTIFALILTGHTISPPTAFTVLAFISVLRSSVSVVLASVFEIFVSLKRIQTFLLLDNMLDPLEYSQTSLGQALNTHQLWSSQCHFKTLVIWSNSDLRDLYFLLNQLAALKVSELFPHLY